MGWASQGQPGRNQLAHMQACSFLMQVVNANDDPAKIKEHSFSKAKRVALGASQA